PARRRARRFLAESSRTAPVPRSFATVRAVLRQLAFDHSRCATSTCESLNRSDGRLSDCDAAGFGSDSTLPLRRKLVPSAVAHFQLIAFPSGERCRDDLEWLRVESFDFSRGV